LCLYDDVYKYSGSFQKAEAELAYELQAAKEKQKIRSEEIEIEVVERRKQIEVEEKEIQRKEKELISLIKRPAEAEAYKVEQLAEGQRLVCCIILSCQHRLEKHERVTYLSRISIHYLC
jgi:hypothetical protein